MKKMIKILSVLVALASVISILSVGHAYWFPPGGTVP